jgi:MoxR-like ATPase
MQEFSVTVRGHHHTIQRPFFVLATQNPIELEGTYPLPEAQLDRFMFNIVMTYLPEDEEVRVVTQTTSAAVHEPSRVLSGAEILEIQQLVREVIVADDVARYAVRLVDASRPGRQSDHQFIREWVKWGAGLRASQSLILAGKARALMQGRYHVSVADIQALARPVLRHRVIPNFYAESERISPDNLVERLLEAVPPPRSGM